MGKIGKYKILETIGRGGMGVVYKAYDPHIDRQVAIKVISDEALKATDVKERFLREARTAGKLSHDNITIVHDFGESNGKTYIVMEYLTGRDLRSVVTAREAIPLSQKIEYIKQICSGLQFAHNNHVIHRDIKPENIQILENNRIKIMDFGIAKPERTDVKNKTTDPATFVTQVGMRLGTPWYMSPEQVQGTRVDQRSDIFSFGVLAYEFLTYEKPFDGDDTTVMYKILHEEPEKINIKESGLTSEIQFILSKCLGKDPNSRYNDCQELMEDLINIADKAQQEKKIKDLLQNGTNLLKNKKLKQARAKFSAILKIDPDHPEANKQLKRLLEKEKETRLLGIIAGKMSGQVISHFKLIDKLGDGGMGVVYKAEDLTLKRTVALKFLLPELSRDEDAKKRLFKEARAASAIDHPNICTIHEISETEDGLIFICMAYYDGEDLRKKATRSKIEITDCLDIFIQIARGLVQAHEHGMIHRDIKPGNIIITNDGDIKIVDFGLAKITNSATRITKPGAMMGTLYYLSPEQVKYSESDYRSDIWSFGVMLYELLTTEYPFKGEYEAEVLYSIVNEEPAPPSKLNNKIPVELDALVRKTLRKEPDERYSSMQEIHDELENIHWQITRKRRFAQNRLAKLAELIETGKKQFYNNQFDEASMSFQGALKLAPKDEELIEFHNRCRVKISLQKKLDKFLVSGKKNIVKGKFDKALNNLQNIIAIDPNHRESLNLIKKIEFERSQSELIGKLLNQAIIYLKENRSDQAVSTFKKVLEIDASNKPAAHGLKQIEKKITQGSTQIISTTESRLPTRKLTPILLTILTISLLSAGGYYFYTSNSGFISSKLHEITQRFTRSQPGSEQFTTKDVTMANTLETGNGKADLLLPKPAEKGNKIPSRVQPKIPAIPTSGRCLIKSTPAGALVFLDGKQIGRTPLKKSGIKDGRYQIELRLPGYKVYSKSITISANKTATLTTLLTMLTGGLAATSTPSNAEIFLDNKSIGRTPVTIRNIKPGNHQILLKKTDFQETSSNVTIVSGQVYSLNKTLIPTTGTLQVSVRPFGSIYIDGKLHKKEWEFPYKTNIPLGVHLLKAVHPTLGIWQREIIIRGTDLQTVNINFTRNIKISIGSQPTWGEIFIDGKSMGETTKVISLRVGLRNIEVRRNGYTTIGGKRVINVEEDMTAPIVFKLLKQ